MASDSAAYGLEQPVRAMCSVPTPPTWVSGGSDEDSQSHFFLAGTASFQGANKLVLLRYREDTRLIEAIADWAHDEEVFALSCAPTAPLAAAIATSSTGGVVRVARLNEPDGSIAEAEVACRISSSSRLATATWRPKGGQRLAVASRSNAAVGFIDVAKGGDIDFDKLSLATIDSSAAQEASRFAPAPVACWDPHHADVLYAAAGSRLARIDARQPGGQATALFNGEAVTAGHVTCIDHNPNQMHALTTAGSDGYVRYWDARKMDSPVADACRGVLRSHEHAVSVLAVNPFRDELLLTASGDHSVKVWYDPRKPLDAAADWAAPAKLKPGVTAGFPEAGEAVYCAAWSAASPWVFAACSYTGKVQVDDVPQDLKMQLLLAE